MRGKDARDRSRIHGRPIETGLDLLRGGFNALFASADSFASTNAVGVASSVSLRRTGREPGSSTGKDGRLEGKFRAQSLTFALYLLSCGEARRGMDATSGHRGRAVVPAARDMALLAVADSMRQWTYGELHARSNQLAHALRARGIGPGKIVAIHAERNALDTAFFDRSTVEQLGERYCVLFEAQVARTPDAIAAADEAGAEIDAPDRPIGSLLAVATSITIPGRSCILSGTRRECL